MIKDWHLNFYSSNIFNIFSIIGSLVLLNSILIFFFLKSENTEFISYFVIFFIIIGSYLISKINFIYTNKYIRYILIFFKYFFFIIFIYFFIKKYNFAYLHLYFFLLSILFVGISHASLNLLSNFSKKFYDFLLYFFILYFSSLVFYWSNIDNVIFLKIREASQYIKWAPYIEIIIPSLFIFLSLFLLYWFRKILSNLDVTKFHKLFNLLILIICIVFFIECFSTYNFFTTIGGGVEYHWQAIIGPNQMLDQGGYLLWDTPATYGYLSHLFIHYIPLDDKWLSFYWLNSSLNFLMCIIFVYTFCYKKNLTLLLFAFLLTYNLMFIVGGGNGYLNVLAINPSSNGFRFIWITVLLFVLINLRNLPLIKQFPYVYVIYITGFLWSFESAFFVSAALIPYFLHHTLYNTLSIKNFFLFLTIPVTLLLIILLIILYYYISIGVFPDFSMYIGTTTTNIQGFFSNLIADYNNLIIHLIILSIICLSGFKHNYDYLFFSIVLSLWAISSHYVGQSGPSTLLKFFPLYVYGFFLSIRLLEDDKIKYKLVNIFPVILIILSINLSNPKIIVHIYETLKNQDYSLSETTHDLDKTSSELINYIDVDENTPIYFIEKSRYLNLINISYNYDANNSRRISNLVLFPFYPPSVVITFNDKTINTFKKRWISKLSKSEYKDSLVIIPSDFHWSKRIREIVLDHDNLYEIIFFKKYKGYEIYKMNFNN